MTNFVLVETLFWKKPNSYPMTSSRTAMSRSVEQVFVFVRKSERATFRCNKTRDPVTKKYSYASSFIEAANNDGATESTCRARFSTDFAKQVLSKYLAKRKRSTVVLDPFVGSGEQSLVPDSPLFTHTHTHTHQERRFAPVPILVSHVLESNWLKRTWTRHAFRGCL